MKTKQIKVRDMKKIFALFLAIPLFFSCSEDIMDEINQDRNNALEMDAKNILPDLTLKSAFESTATDLAWYATVYAEHNAGSWNQSHQADQRVGQTAASLLNNSWNALYDVMNISKTIIEKTDPVNGTEPTNFYARGIAQILMAYNLAMATDFWGEVPYSEALMGSDNLNPVYQNQSEIYPIIFQLLDDGIASMEQPHTALSLNQNLPKDYIFGTLGNGSGPAGWIKAANSLKARYHLRLTNVDNQAAQKALTALEGALASAADEMKIGGFEVALPGANPWGEFWYWRDHLSVSSTIFDLMTDRNDPRMSAYFNSTDPADIAPIGEAVQTQGGYAQSNYTSGWAAFEYPVYMLTFHEVKFLEAEAKFRTNDSGWQDALQAAVEAAFEFHGVASIDTVFDENDNVVSTFNYFEDEVLPRLTAGNELEEIMTQKYIAFYDREAIETYNDVRRTGFPEMMNPKNATVGFVNRAPFPVSEVSSNSANVPVINVFEDKVWWAGGDEKL
jgi:hypothetical protein